MKRSRIICPLLLLLLLLCLVLVAEGQTFVRGSAEGLIREIRQSMPGVGTNAFIVPTTPQLDTWGTVFTEMKSSSFATVSALVAPFGYSLLCLFDTLTAESLYVLKENIPPQRGWGTYMFNPRARNDVSIEIPHARSDTNTCVMGARAFWGLNAFWGLFSGTHRYANVDSSSDMSHVTQSVFHKAHQTIAANRSIQLHGFDRTNPIYNGYPQIVVSNGTTSPPTIFGTLKSKYESKGFSAGVFSTTTYSQLWRLGATLNKQGQWSNSNGKQFVHVEHELPIRLDSSMTAAAVEALYETFTPTSAVEGECLPNVFVLEQNFPNPFNPTTRIGFSLAPDAGKLTGTWAGTEMYATLKVYDVTGTEIATLLEGRRGPGTHSIVWDASGTPTGVYFYRLTAGGWSVAKRMLLLR